MITNDLLKVSSYNFKIMRYTTDYVDAKGNLTHPDTEYEQTEEQNAAVARMIASTPQFSDSST